MIKIFKSTKEYTDTGFSSVPENEPERLINQNGSLNIIRTGFSFFTHFSVFHELIRMKWWKFNVIVASSYLIINLSFAFIYLWIGVEGLNVYSTEDNTSNFLNAFYFSAQTFSTVGYGRQNPVSNSANLVAVVEMLVGMMYLALAAGLLYGRFSRPVSKIIFSKNAVIAPYKDGKGLMFRFSNAKNNLLIDVEVQVLMTMHMDLRGKEVRKFFELNLERKQINMLAMSWTVVHPIDERSPLRDLTEKDLLESNPEFLVFVNAVNDTNSQLVHTRTSYKQNEIVWDAKFTSIYKKEKNKTIVHIDKLSDYKKVK